MLLLLLLLLIIYFYPSCQIKLKSQHMCRDILPLLVPSTHCHPKENSSFQTPSVHQALCAHSLAWPRKDRGG